MKNKKSPRHLHAFTLVELLIVIAVIALLAALVVGLAGVAGTRMKISRVQGELAQLESAIESYKAKKGSYPPDNPANSGTNALYYELVGTTNDPVTGNFGTLNGQDAITVAMLTANFGTNIDGFVNSSRASKSDENFDVQNFYKQVKPGQLKEIQPGIRILAVPVDGPGKPPINPWHYVSSHPINNPESFDLWADILVGGKTNRICNWSKSPIVVAY